MNAGHHKAIIGNVFQLELTAISYNFYNHPLHNSYVMRTFSYVPHPSELPGMLQLP